MVVMWSHIPGLLTQVGSYSLCLSYIDPFSLHHSLFLDEFQLYEYIWLLVFLVHFCLSRVYAVHSELLKVNGKIYCYLAPPSTNIFLRFYNEKNQKYGRLCSACNFLFCLICAQYQWELLIFFFCRRFRKKKWTLLFIFPFHIYFPLK